MNYPPPQQVPQKKGLSPLAIVLIVIGVIAVLVLGTCAAGALFVTHEVKEVAKSIGDGGLVLASPPEVVSALAGPKKEYVGNWRSLSGKSTMVISPSGQLDLQLAETGSRETLNLPIAAFIGDDMDLRMGIEMRVKVTSAPHKVGDTWQMVAKGVTFERTSR